MLYIFTRVAPLHRGVNNAEGALKYPAMSYRLVNAVGGRALSLAYNRHVFEPHLSSFKASLLPLKRPRYCRKQASIQAKYNCEHGLSPSSAAEQQ
jgi:hypothetical protein